MTKIWLYTFLMHRPKCFEEPAVSIVGKAIEGLAPDGTVYGSVSGVTRRDIPNFVKPIHSAPGDVFDIKDYTARYYTIMRIGIEQDVHIILSAQSFKEMKKFANADENIFFVNKLSDMGTDLDKLTLIVIKFFLIAYVIMFIILRFFYSWKQAFKIISIPFLIMLMTVQFGEESFSAPVYIIADATGIFITIMNDFGIDMGVLEYDGDSVLLDCAIVPQKLKGEYLINEFQNAFYESVALKENLAGSKVSLVLEQNKEDGSYVRKMYDGKKIIEEVFFLADGKIEINNILRNYKIIFTPSL